MRLGARNTLIAGTLGFAALIAMTASCTGGGLFSTASSSAGGVGGASASASSGGSGVVLDSGLLDPPDPPIPVVACEEATTNEDAGADADVDAAASAHDGGTDASTDGGETSVCDTPPPGECLNGRWMAVFQPGPCSDGACAFTVEHVACPHGCFRQIDGGDGCNK